MSCSIQPHFKMQHEMRAEVIVCFFHDETKLQNLDSFVEGDGVKKNPLHLGLSDHVIR